MYYSLINSMSKTPSSVSDADAQAFITSASITDATQKSAINTLVTDLKSYGIWSKMKAIYPIVGGTASSHRFNLKDPRDLNVAFRLVFNGGGTHGVNGYKPNGTTTYVDTFFNPSLNLSSATSSNHISTYIRENIDEVKVDMGYFAGSAGYGLDIESRILNTSYYNNYRASNYISFANTDSRGLHINTRTTSTLQKIFINSTLKATDTNSITGGVNGSISIASRYNTFTSSYDLRSSKEIAFATIGDGLTDAEASDFYTAVQKYQTSLGRNV